MYFSSDNIYREVGSPRHCSFIILVKICSCLLFGLPHGTHAKAAYIQLLHLFEGYVP